MVYNSFVCAKLLQLCLTLCDPMDHSLPVSSVHGILQGRIMEEVMLGLSGLPAGPVAGSGGSWSLSYAQPGLGQVADTHALVGARTSSKSQGQLQPLWQVQGFWGQHALLWFWELARDMSTTVKAAEGSQASGMQIHSQRV